jgi:hypothetical protein
VPAHELAHARPGRRLRDVDRFVGEVPPEIGGELADGIASGSAHVVERTGLRLNTVKNYRAQLVPDLELHGLRDPSLKEMGEFAQRCQSFLVPYLEQSSSR